MEKKDITFFKRLISENHLEGKTIYTDDLNIGLPNSVIFFYDVPFDFSLPKEEAVEKKFNEIVEKYKSKDNRFADRFVEEYLYNKEKYIQKLSQDYDSLKNKKIVTSLPDEDDAIIILVNPKKQVFTKAIVFMKENIKKTASTFQEFKLLAFRGRYCWTCNKPLNIDKKMVLCEDKTIESEDLPYPMLDLNYYPNPEKDILELCILNPKQTARFRKLKTHKFVGSSDGKSVALLINKQIAGVIGYNQVFTTFYGSFDENELFLQFSIACTPFDRRVRMGKLVDKVALWDKTAMLMLNDYEKEKYTHIVSTSITQYPECKHARRLMKLKSRKFDEKTQMYNLVYGCEMTHQKDLKEIYLDWMKKEKL